MSYLAEELLRNPIILDKDTLTGELPSGYVLKFRRYLNGFSVNLRITVANALGHEHVVHDTVAKDAERNCFNALRDRAQQALDERHAYGRSCSMNATKEFFAKY